MKIGIASVLPAIVFSFTMSLSSVAAANDGDFDPWGSWDEWEWVSDQSWIEIWSGYGFFATTAPASNSGAQASNANPPAK